jgi:hypothetical protein
VGIATKIQLTGVQLGAVVKTPASATAIGHQHRAAAGAPWEIGTAADGAAPEDARIGQDRCDFKKEQVLP